MTDKALTNFIVPMHIKSRFDEVCRASGRTRTSVLVELMENYILSQGKALALRNEEIEKVDRTLEKSRNIKSFKEFVADQAREDQIARHYRSDRDFGPPSMFLSDGQDGW